MDYVLFGMGYGASLMLLGWALRTFGPQFKYSRPSHDDDVDLQVEQRFWVRFIQGLGGAIAIAGVTLVLMTFVVVLVNPDDETGGLIALSIWAFLLVAMLLWCWMYVKHYGLTGVWSQREGYGLRKPKQPKARALSRSTEPSMGARVSATTRPDREHTIAPATSDAIVGESDVFEVAPAEAHETAVVEEMAAVDGDPEPEVTDSAIYDFGDTDDTTVPSDVGGRSEALRRLRERQARARRSTS